MTQTAEAAFRALADPTRREIVALLAKQDLSIGAVTQNFEMTRPAVKKHLSILAKGNLIHVQPRGRERVNRLNPEGLQAVTAWVAQIDQFWTHRLNALKDIIETETQND